MILQCNKIPIAKIARPVAKYEREMRVHRDAGIGAPSRTARATSGARFIAFGLPDFATH
jgi:hypothetical protein